MKEGPCHVEHWVLYGSVRSLYCAHETNTTPYVNHSGIERKKYFHKVCPYHKTLWSGTKNRAPTRLQERMPSSSWKDFFQDSLLQTHKPLEHVVQVCDFPHPSHRKGSEA